MGFDAALYTQSIRAAEGRVGHPFERNLQFHDVSKSLHFLNTWKAILENACTSIRYTILFNTHLLQRQHVPSLFLTEAADVDLGL